MWKSIVKYVHFDFVFIDENLLAVLLHGMIFRYLQIRPCLQTVYITQLYVSVSLFGSIKIYVDRYMLLIFVNKIAKIKFILNDTILHLFMFSLIKLIVKRR